MKLQKNKATEKAVNIITFSLQGEPLKKLLKLSDSSRVPKGTIAKRLVIAYIDKVQVVE